MSHQDEAIKVIETARGRLLLADDMGLGKSRVVIEFLRRNKIKGTVVTTKSFLYGWKAEVSKWWPEARVNIFGEKGYDPTSDVTLTTYDRLWRTRYKMPGEALVYDESHKLANPSSKRSKAAAKQAVGRKHVLCVTGTPQPNGQPRQLWFQLLLVGPTFLSWAEYRDKFCDPQEVWAGYLERYVWDYSGASNLPELRELLKGRMLRRTKELLNLPPLTISDTVIPVILEREPDESWPTYAVRLATKKVPYAVALVGECLERGSKVLVFCNNVAVRDALLKELDATTISADMNAAERAGVVKAFQEESSVRTLVATTGIAAEGITLTAAEVVVFVDLPWSPGTYEQAIARCHRKGQSKPAHVYRLMSSARYDTVVAESLDKKQEVTREVLDDRC